MKFTKWQGCGNDFVIADWRALKGGDPSALAKRICDRHYGVGADGLIFVANSNKADFRMRIFNADGSEAEMCGNGIRCFARMLYEEELTRGAEFTVETGAGILTPKVLTEGDKITGIRVDMGEPLLNAEEIPVKGFNRIVVNAPIEVLGEKFRATCVSMGNPHCVVFVDDPDDFEVEKYGSAFETHEWFPRRTNTEFVTVRPDGSIRMRVWERGAAVTLACGTGACASLVAASLTGRSGKSADVILDGGSLFIEWSENNHIYMTGGAEKVFSGSIEN